MNFPPILNDQGSLDVMRFIHDWALDRLKDKNVDTFFQSLAATLGEVFKAKMVAIWGNNYRNNSLVLQASSPARDDIVVSHAIATETSSTGAAVEKRDIIFFPNILNPGGKRHFTHPGIVELLQLKSMLSIPVFSPDREDKVDMVINLCFDEEHGVGSIIPKTDIKRLTSDLGVYLEYLVYRTDERISENVRTVAATSKGILPLFDRIEESILELTHSTECAIFRWDADKRDFYGEAPVDVMLDTAGKTTRWLSESSDYDEHLDPQLISVCVEQKQTLVVRVDAPSEGKDWQPINVQCPYMATPIHSSANEVLGVIRCKKPLVVVDNKSPSFSSFDVIALESFARAVAPSVERFLRLREGTGLMKIVSDVSKTLSRAYELDTSLENIIETLVKAMHSKFGSIYLRDERTDRFFIRAATKPRKQLIEKNAEYGIGEGVTGDIATGKLLNFRTREELRSYPHRLGKYHGTVWGKGSTDDSDTLLGVPIVAGNKVIGVWKIENVCQSEAHPDPYYTDEDVQAAQVISFFLTYVIQNYKQEQARLRHLTQLPITSDLKRASDEESAIKVVMSAIENAGFTGALLSLYSGDTRLLTEREFSGTTWAQQDVHPCHINDHDIRAIVLTRGEEELVLDSIRDSRCRNNPEGGNLKSQFVLPLRFAEELIGTIQVDLGINPSELERLTLKVFASHLEVAIFRLRSLQRMSAFMEQIMQSARFTTAEALSGVAVHSFSHKLLEINKQLNRDLSRKEIRESSLLKNILSEWQKKFYGLEVDLKNALRFISTPVDETQPLSVNNLHREIQSVISTWINYIHSNRCKITPKLDAESSECLMPAAAFREIITALLVNAVQAHARHIEIKTYNEALVKTARGGLISNAFCIQCRDNGIGLATKDYDKLFEPTYTTKPKNIGTGLGLFVARRLAERHHSSLDVITENLDAEWTTFRLSIPLARGFKGLSTEKAD